MIRHILMFRWNEKSDPEQRRSAVRALRSLQATVPEVRDLTVAENLNPGSGGYDGVMEATFTDLDAFGRYVGNASHQQMWLEQLQPLWADMASVQVSA